MKVDFYVLENSNQQQALRFACGLLEKAYANQQQAYVHMNSETEADRMDALLWTYRDDSFIPHTVLDKRNQNIDLPPIQIGYNETLSQSIPTVLFINLSNSLPAFYTQFPQLIEIVFADPAVQQFARERFRQYREDGCELTTHKINVNER